MREEDTLLSKPLPAVGTPESDDASEELPNEDSVSDELPKEDDTSEETEAAAIDQVAEELDALDDLLPVDAEAATVDLPAIRASLANIRAALDLK